MQFSYQLKRECGSVEIWISIRNLSDEKKKLGNFKIVELLEIDGPLYLNNWQSWLPFKRFESLPNLPAILNFAQTNEVSLFTASPIPELLMSGKIPSDYFIAGEKFLIGALASKISHPYFLWDEGRRAVGVYVELFGKPLESGKVLELEPFIVLEGKYQENLERYALKVAEYNGAKFKAFEGVGWCSWYHYFTEITYDDLKKNVKILKKLREEKGIPYSLVQLDDGYQKDIGDWTDTNEKFPTLEEIASTIKSAGFKAGLWLAPFSVAETSSLFHKHPEWLVKNPDGKPKVVYRNWNKNIYALDTTHPGALDFLKNTLKEIRTAGFSYIKIDFLFAGMVPGLRYDTKTTPVEAYHRGLTTIREALGEGIFILGCGAPLLPSVGYMDGMRIGADTDPEWKGNLPDLGMPSAKYAIRNAITRYFMNKAFWHNDPDTMILRNDAGLTESERELYAFTSGLLNNMLLQSDDMTRVDESGIEILKEAIELSGGRPRVYYVSDELFVIAVKGGRHFNSIAVVNIGDDSTQINVPPSALSWSGVELSDNLINMEPRSVKLFKTASNTIELNKSVKLKEDGRKVNYYEEE
ncbi:glycoside hydrolase [Kosmotoga pacifica]|uniref:Glycoside hydrolase n=1 Tax=Kosmotoga pacifica TaxID=1330330 RepID=A0A0G2Z9I6_9BACT|nr:glycoside hydrolase [Kosmotoga pacifica]